MKVDPMADLSCLLRRWGFVGAIVLCVATSGCVAPQTLSPGNDELIDSSLLYNSDGFGDGSLDVDTSSEPGKEGKMLSLPAYRIEPPDVLLIDLIRMAPKAPYFVQTMDILQIIVAGTLPEQPIAGNYQVMPSGMISLGPSYGSVKVDGLTINQINDEITKKLRQSLQGPEVSVSLLQTAGQQQVAGEHMVGPDGTVNLGIYGNVWVAGMTLEEAKKAVEKHLSRYLDQPEVSVDVFAYNSKVYYVITEGAGFGDGVQRIAVTGNETVLDAVAQIGGLTRMSSKKMWIARRAPSGVGCDQVIPIDWQAITKGGSTSTNYQLMPGDRLFIAQDRMMAFDGMVSKVTQPFERMFGFLLLGSQTLQNLRRFPRGQNF